MADVGCGYKIYSTFMEEYSIFMEEQFIFMEEQFIFMEEHSTFLKSLPYSLNCECRMGTYRKIEGIQSYLRIWGSYNPIESGLSETQKGGL